MRFLCKKNALTTSIYIDLRRRVNFKEYRKEDVETTVANPLYPVVVLNDKHPIGTVRIVGDDRIAFFVKDVVVDPTYQKGRIGDLPMQKLQEHPASAACEGAYVGLTSTPNCVPLYKKHGFLERPCDGMGSGTVKFYDPREVRK